MPNHVTTICTVTGPSAQVAAFAEKHIVPREDKTGRFFDFATVIPKPAIVGETESGSQADLGLWCLSNDGYARPDMRFQFLRVKTGRDIVNNRELRAYLEEHEPGIMEKGRKAAQCIAETGYANWYDWSIANWGTKWGAYDYEDRERSDGRFVFKFETAWSFPEKIFRTLAAMWSTLVFDVVAFDEGWNFGCEGQFNGRNDYRCAKELATDAMYERVYGRKPPTDEDDEDATDVGSPCLSERKGDDDAGR